MSNLKLHSVFGFRDFEKIELTSRRAWLLEWGDGYYDTAINQDFAYKFLMISLMLLSSLVKRATPIIRVANNYNSSQLVKKDPRKIDDNQFKCMFAKFGNSFG